MNKSDGSREDTILHINKIISSKMPETIGTRYRLVLIFRQKMMKFLYFIVESILRFIFLRASPIL